MSRFTSATICARRHGGVSREIPRSQLALFLRRHRQKQYRALRLRPRRRKPRAISSTRQPRTRCPWRRCRYCRRSPAAPPRRGPGARTSRRTRPSASRPSPAEHTTTIGRFPSPSRCSVALARSVPASAKPRPRLVLPGQPLDFRKRVCPLPRKKFLRAPPRDGERDLLPRRFVSSASASTTEGGGVKFPRVPARSRRRIRPGIRQRRHPDGPSVVKHHPPSCSAVDEKCDFTFPDASTGPAAFTYTAILPCRSSPPGRRSAPPESTCRSP